jgi:hypothetical protein
VRQAWFAVLLIATLTWTVFAQEAISAKAGMVNYFEGSVELNGQALEFKPATFHQVPEGGKLHATEKGRAEVLLSPGVLLWLGESSEIELVSSDLANARVRLLSGKVVVSGSEFPKGAAVRVLVRGDEVKISQPGIFSIDFNSGELVVHEGAVDVARANGNDIRVKKGRVLALNDASAGLGKFDKNAEADVLMLWARSRDHHIQVANISAARQIQTQGMGSGMPLGLLGAYRDVGGWVYNPYFGMYTYVPFASAYMNPWGSYFWTPRTVNRVYDPSYGWAGLGRGGAPRQQTPSVRLGFPDGPAMGGYARGASSMGSGSFGGSPDGGTFSRGASSVGAPSGGVSPGASAPTSSGGASMGRGGGATAGRAGGGGRN